MYDILDTLGGSNYFKSLDLVSGYRQVGMDAESAFVRHGAFFEFVRMLIGMCNSPATFQWLIELDGIAMEGVFREH